MLLNMPQCTGPPSTTENYLAPTVAMLRLRNTMHVSTLEDLSWKLLVKFISITFPHFGTHFFHFQQIFEFLLCAGPCNMSWETRIKQQRWGLQTSCCGGSYMTLLPSWCTPKSKSESAIMVGHMDAGTRELEFKCWLLLLGLLLLLFAPQFVIFRMVVLMIPLMW